MLEEDNKSSQTPQIGLRSPLGPVLSGHVKTDAYASYMPKHLQKRYERTISDLHSPSVRKEMVLVETYLSYLIDRA
jgi:hypothetical protein